MTVAATGIADGASLAGIKLGFLGPGSIGAPMVARLVAAGADVAVCVRRAEIQAELRRAGANVFAGVGAAITARDVVVSCLYSDEQLIAVSDELVDALDPDSIFISHTTGSPTTLQGLAERLADSGRVVDAPFSGTAQDVAAGTLTVMIGGEGRAADRAEQIVRAYASTIIRTGGPGSALLVKLVNNVAFAAHSQLALDVARVGAALGLSDDVLLAAVQSSSGASRAIDHMTKFADPDAFARTIQPYLAKDVAVCMAVGQDVGVDLGLLARVIAEGSIPVAAPSVSPT